ncbi:hypothetical protein PG999_011730 [Apiospora kogelbergensis]|uniref:Uncharacterized protein n=1 Tax=Apiospora kogelbergensis TaxID=1337665 RepID=A0AAW0QG84_9PEZI
MYGKYVSAVLEVLPEQASEPADDRVWVPGEERPATVAQPQKYSHVQKSSVMLAEKGAARLESTAAGTTTIVVTDYWQLAATMQMCIWDVSNHTMPVKISPMGYQAFHTLR